MQRLVAFRDERDWQQFHNPKDLAAALSIEAAELQELFLWKPATDLGLESAEKRERIEDEVADIGAFFSAPLPRTQYRSGTSHNPQNRKKRPKIPHRKSQRQLEEI